MHSNSNSKQIKFTTQLRDKSLIREFAVICDQWQREDRPFEVLISQRCQSCVRDGGDKREGRLGRTKRFRGSRARPRPFPKQGTCQVGECTVAAGRACLIISSVNECPVVKLHMHKHFFLYLLGLGTFNYSQSFLAFNVWCSSISFNKM